jgi:hypothetical protein
MHVVIAGNEDFILNNVGLLLNVCDDRCKAINNIITKIWLVGKL